MQFILSISGLVAVALAQSSSSSSGVPKTSDVEILYPYIDPTFLGLSVVTAAPESTIYTVGCGRDAHSSKKDKDCVFGTDSAAPWITMDFQGDHGSYGVNFTTDTRSISETCTVTETSKAHCNLTVFDLTRTTSRRTQSTYYYLSHGKATITAGLEKLTVAASTTSDTASASSSASSASSSASSASTSSSASASSASSASAASTSTSSGDATRETGAMKLLAAAGLVGAGLVL